jgi:hypothetical protein
MGCEEPRQSGGFALDLRDQLLGTVGARPHQVRMLQAIETGVAGLCWCAAQAAPAPLLMTRPLVLPSFHEASILQIGDCSAYRSD